MQLETLTRPNPPAAYGAPPIAVAGPLSEQPRAGKPLAAMQRRAAMLIKAAMPVTLFLLAWAMFAFGAGCVLVVAAPPVAGAGQTLVPIVAAVTGLALVVGIRQVVFVVAAHLPHRAPASTPAPSQPNARVAILYPVANDFRAGVVRQSARQTHPGTRMVVLDDSSDPAVRAQIDELEADGIAEVHRRKRREGAKAGNLNAWLDLHSHEVDYVVILDADQVADPHFVAGALVRAAAHPRAAVVQGSIGARASGTAFSSDFAGLFTRHAAMQLAARARLGNQAFAGRGALLDVAAVRAVGGIPEVVMEDTALTIALARAGRTVVAAPELQTTEDAPIDHAAFAVQFGKFTQGATQLLARSGATLTDPRLPVLRRLDLLLELLVPVVAGVMPVALGTAAIVAAGMGEPAFPWQLALPLGVVGFAPLIPESIARMRQRGIVRGVAFGARASMLYASVSLAAVKALVSVGVTRRAKFRITPKRRSSGARATVLRNVPEVAIAITAFIAALWATGRPDVAMPIVGMIVAAIAFGLRDAVDGRGKRGPNRRSARRARRSLA